MSGVATLKLRGAKRHFDEMAVDLPVPPQACSPSRYPLRPPPLKRGRCAPSPISTPTRHPILSSSLSSSCSITPIPTSTTTSSSNTNMPPAPPPTPADPNNPPLVSANDAKHLLLSHLSAQHQHHLQQQGPVPLSSVLSNDRSCARVGVVDKCHNQTKSDLSGVVGIGNRCASATNSHNNKSVHSNTNCPSSSCLATTSTGPSSIPCSSHHHAQHQQQQVHDTVDNNCGDEIDQDDQKSSMREPVVVSADELAALARHLPRRLKRVLERLSEGQVATSDRLFTLSDLKEIVSSVLAENEAKLRDQFTLTLNERLAEQFRDFTKFNEDYVSRQLRGTDVAYLS